MLFLKSSTVLGKPYDIHHVTGEVLKENKSQKTEVTGRTSAYDGSGSTETKITEVDEFILSLPDGKERAFRYENIQLATRVGAQMSVVLIMKPGKDRGWEVVVINHNTGNAAQLKDLKTVCGPNMIWPLGICAALILGAFSMLEFSLLFYSI